MEPSEAGSTVTCPECGRRYRVREEMLERSIRCRGCDAVFVAGTGVAIEKPRARATVRSRRPSSVAARARARRGGEDPSFSPDAREHRWASRWAIGAGIAILLGMLFPIAVARADFRAWTPGMGRPIYQTQWVWLWDALKHADAKAVFGMFALLSLGILAIVAGTRLRGRTQGLTLLVAGGAALLISFVVGALELRTPVGRTTRGAGQLIFSAFFLLSIPVLAAGNHLRRHCGRTKVPGFLTAGAGALLAVCYLLPVFDGEPLITLGARRELWSEGNWPFGLVCYSLLVYGILGILGLGKSLALPMTPVLGILARTLMIGVPLLFLVSIGIADAAGAVKTQALVLIFKMLGLIYGLLVVVGLGLAGTLLPVLRGQDARLEEDRRMRLVEETF